MSEVAKVKDYSLDNLALLWQEFQVRKQRCDEDARWIKEFKAQIDRLSGGAEVYQLAGAEVATYRRNGNLNLTKLEKEQPEVVARYTEMVAEHKFNKERFEAEQPELFAQYRAKVWRMVEGTSINVA